MSSLLPHPINEWKLKTTTEEERQTESIVRLSFEVKILAPTIKLAYNLKWLNNYKRNVSTYKIWTE